MIITSDEIQAAWITKLKSNSLLTAEVSADQIKETQPQTTEFSYPGIRVRVDSNIPGENECGQDVILRALVYSENASSQQVMRIAGIIMSEFHNKAFTITGLSQAMNITNLKVNPGQAIRIDRITWLSEVILTMTVS